MGTSDDNSKDMGFIHVQQWQTLHRKQQERHISGGPFFLGGGGGGGNGRRKYVCICRLLLMVMFERLKHVP